MILSGRELPILTVHEAVAAIALMAAAPPTIPPPPVGDGDGEGAGVGTEPPPETAVTVAVPERVSEIRLTRTTPSLVFPCSWIRPRLVKNCTTVPSGTGVPAGSITRAEITDTSPFAAMNSGFAKQESSEPGGAVRIA
jgi:hypothetical protein